MRFDLRDGDLLGDAMGVWGGYTDSDS